MAESLKLVVVLGSATKPGRLHRAIGEGLGRLVSSNGAIQTELFDLGALRVAPADGRPPDALGDDTAAIIEAITAADAVVLATPVYRGSMTGVLKNLLDHVPIEALEGKATAIVAMGASHHHFLGAERHLRDVLAFYGALVAPVGLYLSSADFEDGVPTAKAATQVDALLGDLVELARCARARPPGRLAATDCAAARPIENKLMLRRER